MKIDNIDDSTFVLVQWPFTQELMDQEWFDAETSLADHSKYGNSAYFVPLNRYKQYVKEEEEREKKLLSGASVKWNGTLCKAEEFTSRMNYADSKYNPTDEAIAAITALPFTDYETIPSIDNPNIYEWYQVGRTKYGRSMYCPRTNIKRSQTMGEFYGNSIID